MDVNCRDFTIDVAKIEEAITDKTVAIMATHVYGVLCDVEAIDKIAHKHNLKVIYDAAHAFGVKKDGKDVSHWGDMVMFSTHATKVFHTIEGGITVFKDKAIQSRLNSLVNFGFNGPEDVVYVSTNARMNEFEAAMGLCNLRHFGEEVSKRAIAAQQYHSRLDSVKGVHFIAPQPGVSQNYAYFPVFFDGYKYSRDEIQEKLAKESIFARKYFFSIIPELSCYKEKYSSLLFPVASHASQVVLALPMFADLSTDDVDRICDIILK